MFILKNWDHLESFINDQQEDDRGEEFDPPSLSKLRALLANADKVQLIRVQLALLHDAGRASSFPVPLLLLTHSPFLHSNSPLCRNVLLGGRLHPCPIRL